MDFKVKETEKVYHGSRVVVYRDFVQQPDGSEVTREVVSLDNAAAIVPLTREGEVVLIRQFRYAVKGVIIEIPAGTFGGDEKPEDCARRELEEETGYRAGRLTRLGRIHTSPGVCTEVIHLFLAEGLEGAPECAQNLDHGEVIEVERVKFEEALDMIKTGGITDAKTVCALLLARRELDRRG